MPFRDQPISFAALAASLVSTCVKAVKAVKTLRKNCVSRLQLLTHANKTLERRPGAMSARQIVPGGLGQSSGSDVYTRLATAQTYLEMSPNRHQQAGRQRHTLPKLTVQSRPDLAGGSRHAGGIWWAPRTRRRSIHASRNLSRAPSASLRDRLRRPWTEPACRQVRQQSGSGRGLGRAKSTVGVMRRSAGGPQDQGAKIPAVEFDGRR